MNGRFLIVDRDGTIIEEKNYLCDPQEVEVIRGIPEALLKFQQHGWGVVVITNQSGVGRGFFTLEQMESVNRRVQELLTSAGVTLAGIYACPHVPSDKCECRKPNPGLALRASRELGFALSDSVVVGDKASDIELGMRIGAKTVLVRTGHGTEEERLPNLRPDLVLDSLADLDPIGLETGDHSIRCI